MSWPQECHLHSKVAHDCCSPSLWLLADGGQDDCHYIVAYNNESTKVPNARRAACIFTNPCTKSIADQQVHTPAYKSMHMPSRLHRRGKGSSRWMNVHATRD